MPNHTGIVATPEPASLATSERRCRLYPIAFPLLAILCSCSASLEQKKSEPSPDAARATYSEWKSRSLTRGINVEALKAELLKVGGGAADLDAVFPSLPKSLVLLAEKPGVLTGYYSNGIAGKWKTRFSRWCTDAGGRVLNKNNSETVYKYVYAISNSEVAYQTSLETDVVTCFESAALDQLGIYDPIASITLARPIKPVLTNPQGYLVVQTGADIAASKEPLELAEKAKRATEQQKEQAVAKEKQTARSGWATASQSLRASLKPGNAVSVVLPMGRMNFLANGMVVEVKRPLAQVQFSNHQPNLQWVKIEDLFAPQVPRQLYCGAAMTPDRDCFQ